jgi:hypothetical protein
LRGGQPIWRRLPALYPYREFVQAGGLASYEPSYPVMFRRAATFVDKILKGAKRADLPVEQPTKFEFVINLKTAKALGLTIPPPLLLHRPAPVVRHKGQVLIRNPICSTRLYIAGRARACAGSQAGSFGVASSLPTLPDQLHSTGAVGTLAGANGRRPRGDLRSAHPRALGEDAPCFLLDRHAVEAGLQPQPFGYFVVEVPDDDRRHGQISSHAGSDSQCGIRPVPSRARRKAPRRQLTSAPPQEEPPRWVA